MQGNQRKKVLFFAQDIGGAKEIAIVNKNLLFSGFNLSNLTLVHSLSEEIFKRYDIEYIPLTDLFSRVPPEEDEIEDYLLREGITHLVSSISSPLKDLTNSLFISVSRKLGIKTLGFFDHWKGFDRFFNADGELVFAPDFIGCIDGFCKRKIASLGIDPKHIEVIGQPYLEHLIQQEKKERRKRDDWRIVLISQPKIRDGSFSPLFLERIGEETIIEILKKQITEIAKNHDILFKYRPHPKDNFKEFLFEDIVIDEKSIGEEVIDDNDIFIGMDSMLMIEACIAGKYCIVLEVPELVEVGDDKFPYNYGYRTNEMQKVETFLREIIENNGNNKEIPEEFDFSGSMEKTKKLFYRIINN